MEEDATLGRIGGFRLVKRLATGGTSDVLLARAEGPHGFERTVVLKRLLTEHQNDPEFARMFAREAAAYARLSHPAIVRLFDFFTANGQLIMVLEYVDGASLAKLMTHAAQSQERLDDRVCFFIAARIYDALSAAHDARNPDTGDPTPVIHRDVNPSNVLIPWDGHAKLADFGIAKIGGEESETKQGLIKGTFGYMAPEQVRGERVTIRTDVYAATLVLWELLARRKAIQADRLPEMEILRAMAEPNLPKLDVIRPDLHESVREAVSRGLEPNPAKRSITAEEMMGLLRAHFDPEDARTRLMQAMQPLANKSPSRSFSDTVSDADILPAVSEGVDLSAKPVAMTLPIPTRPAAFAVPRPTPPPPAPPAPAQIAGAVAMNMNPEVRRLTPSGFRPVSAPLPVPPPQVTVPVPFASEAPTLETHPPPQSALQYVPTLPAPVAPMPTPQYALPVLPTPQQRRSLAPVIALAALAGVAVVMLAAVAVVVARMQKEEQPPPTTAVVATTTAAVTTTGIVATARPSATVVVTATATATVTATVTATATVSGSLPTPGRDEGVLILPAYASGHRIFIDGRVKGDGTAPIVTPCGTHTVQIGSAGKLRDMNIPCGALARVE